jgi:hypothetical protein
MVDFKPFDISVIQELGDIGYKIDPTHPQIGKILDDILANKGAVASTSDYGRTYTRGEYTRYDRTHTGFVANKLDEAMRDILAGPEVCSIMKKYGC